ncbi:substrate-binding periplasmic protein [Chitinimonas sp. BJB300]|uniref:substrate-binding periplasmic protein n=1 Tax=Chitinimonas sp. BJB300 TaxID=1559339 RepID=UPI001303FCBD|nr:transporter substrate-binding domain-containing protein [Chitinimonas sp. BJB300]
MRNRFLNVVITFLLSCSCVAAPIQAVTDSYPPFIYLDKNKPAGVAVEVLNALFKESGLFGQIEFLPWQRAYNMGLSDKSNVLVFTMSRTAERENLFKWIGPILNVRVRLYKLKSRNDISSMQLEDARNYRTGVVLGYASEKLLLDAGFEQGKQLDQAINEETNVKKFIAGRFDLICSNDFVLAEELNKAGRNFSEVEPVVTLDKSFDEYMGFSKATDDATVSAFQAAFERLKKSGRYDAILAKQRK